MKALNALIFAKTLYGKIEPNVTVLSLLDVGDRFYFTTNANREPCTKLNKSGGYAYAGKRWKTGKNVAVVKLA